MRIVLSYLFLLAVGSVSAQEIKPHVILFEYDKHDVTPEVAQNLENWLSTLPDTISKMEVVGHADFIGSDNYNLNLSEKRANAVLTIIEEANAIRYRMSLVSANGETESVPNGSKNGIPDDRKVVITATLFSESLIKEKAEILEETSEAMLLETAEVGQSIVFANLNFFPGKHFLIPEALPSLEKLAETLKANPNLEIEIQGHICCKLDSIDGFDQNTRTYDLSINRAKYIYDQLILTGVNNHMTFRGFAGTRPLIFPEVTNEDRQRNRRVEIKVTKK